MLTRQVCLLESTENMNMFVTARFKIILIIFVLATFICSCAPSILTTENLKQLSQQHRVYAVHYSPRMKFIFHSEENAKGESVGKWFGPIGMIGGGFSDIQKGQAYGEILLKKYEIQDPVLRVKTKIIELLAHDANIANIQTFDTIIPSEDTASLKQSLDGEMAIDFKTMSWAMFSNKETPERFTGMYRTRARLIRLEDGKVVWEGECHLKQHDVKKAPTFEELTANQGALLKVIFQEDADACADEIASLFLGRSSHP
jgi:hypothetical protein